MEVQRENSNPVVIGGASLLLGVVCNFLFFDKEIGLNFPIFAVLSVLVGYALSRIFGRSISTSHWFLIASAIFFAAMVFVRESELLTLFNVLGCILLFFIVIASHVGRNFQTYLPEKYAAVIFLPFKFLRPLWETIVDIVGFRKLVAQHPKAKEIIRGSAMALVAVGLFVLLFSSADLVFQKLVSHVFSFDIAPELVGRTIFIVCVSTFFIGLFAYLFGKVGLEQVSSAVSKDRSQGTLETMILLGAINAVFLIFISLQIVYLFGGETLIASQGLTYAEYARRGFFELICVAIFAYIIISYSARKIIQNGNVHFKSFKVLSGILVAQVICILASAFVRLSLYENAYGFSTIRLYSFALMIWLGVVLFLLALHIFSGSGREKFALQAFISVALLLFTMNCINPDAFIARKNIERYQKTGDIDTEYLAFLSNDAIPETVRLLSDSNPDVQKSFAYNLYWARQYSSYGDGWPSARLPQYKAEKLLQSKTTLLEENKLLFPRDISVGLD